MTTIQWRRDTAAAWTAANTILAEGEAGFETDTGKVKVGDGTTAWTGLAYLTAGAESTVNKGVANGYASLDTNGKVPGSQLPNSIMTYEGLHNVSTNSPVLTDAGGDAGQVYRVSVGGTRDYGSGNITLNVGDYLIHNGSQWEFADTTDAVSSINGLTGDVTGIVDLSSAQTLSGKTLSSPTIAGSGVNLQYPGTNFWSGGSIALSVGASAIGAANRLSLTAVAAGNPPRITAAGSDTNVSIDLIPKGSGTVQANGVDVVTTTGAQTLSDKTLTAPVIDAPSGVDPLTVKVNGTTAFSVNQYGEFVSSPAGYGIQYDSNVSTTAFASTGATWITSGKGSAGNHDITINPSGTGKISLAASVVEANGSQVLVNGGALGTPASGTLTNCTGLPVAGISATGTRNSTTYLRGDGTWAATSSGISTGKAIAMAMVFG